jgi:hypothetical protein
MANGNQMFPTLAELAEMDTAIQRRVLRPHKEGGFTSAEEGDIELRRRLDWELQLITERELLAQVASETSENYGDIPEFAKLLKKSPAFVQYLNVYLYFGVRFAAGRISNPCSAHHPSAASVAADCNEAAVGLPSPPPPSEASRFDMAAVERFLEELYWSNENDPSVKPAIDFLDDFAVDGGQRTKSRHGEQPAGDERTNFELWLRGLYVPQREAEAARFRQLAAGLLRWAKGRYDFYTGLESKGEREQWVEDWKARNWEEGRWQVINPVAARCAIADFYWLARILQADVSPRGLVTYSSRSWLDHLAINRPSIEEAATEGTLTKQEILRWEEVLRSVFSYACDLIQNAVEIGEDCEDRKNNPRDYPPLPDDNRVWRAVQDEELHEIRKQRLLRRPESGPSDTVELAGDKGKESHKAKWSRRIATGEDVDNLVGVALSGGGIRSATFNLGVLQHLQELDLLRNIDYLSTVSGGGYIGAWLVGNVRRTRYWLSRMTSWDKSIEHLRRYSNYLAPNNGVLSPDTWTMWGTWIRNAFLIQLTGFVWLACLLISALLVKPVFDGSGQAYKTLAQFALAGSLILIGLILGFYLSRLSHPPDASKKKIVSWAVSKGDLSPKIAAFLVWIASFLTAALLWRQASGWDPVHGQTYSWILLYSFSGWSPRVSVAFILGLLLVARSQVTSARHAFWSVPALIGGAATSYLALSGILRLYGWFIWSSCGVCGDRGGWYAFVFGPVAAMIGVSLAIVIFIGLLGRDAPDQTREWWTRYGAWIGIFGAGALVLALAAVFAPLWVRELVHAPWWASVKVTAVLGWLGSVIGGLLAGKSSQTGREGGQNSAMLQWVAWIGGLLFIVGAIALASAGIHVVLREVLVSNFDPHQYWGNLTALVGWPLLGILALLLFLGWVFSNRFDLNTFGLNNFYRNRLVRCYLGATRWQPGKRHPHLFTGFDDSDDVDLASLRTSNSAFRKDPFRGPFPIINCTLNLGGSSDLSVHTRHSTSFTMTPLYCGAQRKKVEYAPTQVEDEAGYAGKVTLGQAISVSGAAVSPNMGYNTSPLVSFLLTMFNVRLGWWFPNPGKEKWNSTGPVGRFTLVRELFGLAGEDEKFINVSDGGHFENLGIYELIRRRTRVIIAADAECDPDLTFGSLGNVIRICETDFGAKIDIDVASIRKQADSGLSHSHCAVGRIKSSLAGDEDVGIAQYHSAHSTFPHESTADQFFSEDQFEAYRRLGHHIAERTFRDAGNDAHDLVVIASKLFNLWVPASSSNQAFLTHAGEFDQLWDRFRTDQNLAPLFQELTGGAPTPPHLSGPLSAQELCACMELMQLMENVFLDLRLDDFWDHPDNRGWAMFFTMCAKSPKFRSAWTQVRNTYGIRFGYFCHQRLGLTEDRPVVRL